MVGTSNKSDPENPIDRRQCQVPKLKGIWFLPTWLDRIGTWPACGAPVFSWSGIVFWQTPPFVVKKTVLQSPLFGNIYIYIYYIYTYYIYITYIHHIFWEKNTHIFGNFFITVFYMNIPMFSGELPKFKGNCPCCIEWIIGNPHGFQWLDQSMKIVFLCLDMVRDDFFRHV